jgi:hypothetical protein
MTPNDTKIVIAGVCPSRSGSFSQCRKSFVINSKGRRPSRTATKKLPLPLEDPNDRFQTREEIMQV